MSSFLEAIGCIHVHQRCSHLRISTSGLVVMVKFLLSTHFWKYHFSLKIFDMSAKIINAMTHGGRAWLRHRVITTLTLMQIDASCYEILGKTKHRNFHWNFRLREPKSKSKLTFPLEITWRGRNGGKMRFSHVHQVSLITSHMCDTYELFILQ